MPTALRLIEHTLTQFVAFFGLFIAGGFALTLLARWTNNAFRQFLFPRFGLFAFGWLGIPVHEFSHALFCKLFAHRISKVKWFDAKAKGGALGSVTHTYDPWNLYQRIGHFFIGLGPAIVGPILLAVLFHLLVPRGPALTEAAVALPGAFRPVASELLSLLLSRSTWHAPGSYIFVYLTVCIASQIELSKEDVEQAVIGVIPILGVLFAGNVLAWALAWPWHAMALRFAARITGLGAGIFIFAALLSAANLIVCTGVMAVINRVCGREGINPFYAAGGRERS